MRTRLLLPSLSLLFLAGCPEEELPQETTPAPSYKAMDLPDTWESDSSRIIMRITNSSTTTSETHRALTRLFNEQLNVGDMLMRGGLREGPNGEPIAPGTEGVSTPDQHEQMLAGTAVEQARALVERTELDQNSFFPQEMAMDTCGNPMVAAFVTNDTLPYILEGDATQNNIWPKEACGPDASCDTLEHGVWDVAFSETRYDGMVDVALMLQPNASGKTTRPGLFGHLTGFFLSENNPGYSRIPLVANIRQASVSIQGLLKLDRISFDSKGVREVYVYPHSERTLTGSDIVVALIGHEKCEDAWRDTFGYLPPFGCSFGTALGMDLGSATGQFLNENVFRGDPQGIQDVADVLAYQIGAAVSCPGVDGSAWVREGPVELFTCPSGDVDLCIGREDAEDFACLYLDDPTGDGTPIGSALGNAAVIGTQAASSYNLPANGTFVYTYNGLARTLNVNAGNPSASIGEVVSALNNAASTYGEISFAAGPEDSNGNRPLMVSRVLEGSPLDTLQIGGGTLNSQFGFSQGVYGQLELPSGQEPFVLHTATSGPAGYIAIEVPEEGRIYTDQPERIQGLYSDSGQILPLDDPRANTHCPSTGPAAVELGVDPGSLVYLKVTAGDPLWVLPTDPASWIP